jgi:peptidoglycan/LPS O-acetylase OafA/YrhL
MNMTPRHSGDSFRPDLEGLRGVAVLLVVGCHCGISWCAGGFVGVDVFFVLSGYLITGLLASECRTTSRIDLPGFFARRARRLLPESLLVSAVTLLTAVAFLAPQEIITTARAAAAAGLYASNLFFDGNASNYFAPDVAANPLLHTWSLGVEEQFYLVWPVVILLVSRGAQRVAGSIFALAAIAALSFTCSVYTSEAAPTFAFYELPSRAWEFAAGGLLALLPVSGNLGRRNGAMAGGFLGIAMIAGTALLLKGGAGFPGWVALLPVAGTLATLHAGAAGPQRGISAILSAAPLQFLGARSYSWYL